MTEPKPTSEDVERASRYLIEHEDPEGSLESHAAILALEFARARAEEREACLSDCRAVALAFHVEAERRHEASQIRANLEAQQVGAEACSQKIRERGD